MRLFLIPAIAVLLTSLIPQIADAAITPKLRKYTVTMTKAHLPVAPTNGTDDYRCFLLNPKVTQDSIIRTIEFIPQRKNYVHHAIIFRVTDADLPQAIAQDQSGTGWPCFGGTGLGGMLSTFVTSPWLSSWAPGRGKDISPAGYGTPFKKGERFVLQVHYNVLAATDGKIWQLIRVFTLGKETKNHKVGFLAQSPTGEGCEILFEEINFLQKRLIELRDGS